ncbi:Transducin (beta)-like 3 [Coelomomyces lativittatus]|nr:Transducin (beta)-like 3 [Coelomomyces lativittatus]
MAIDETSTLVATGSTDASIRIWDIEGGFCTHVFKGHTGSISQLLFRKLDLISGGEDGNIRIWDLNEKKSKAILKNHVSVVRGLDLVDENTLLSASRDKVVCVWDLISMKIKRTIPIYEALESIVYLGNHLFATAGEKGILRVLHLYEDESEQKKFQVSSVSHSISQLTFQPELKSLLVTTSDHYLILFDTTDDFKIWKQFVGNNDEITDLTFVGSQQNFLAVSSNSADIKLFNTETLDCTIIPGHADVVFCLDSNKDGTLLATGSKDKTARVWSISCTHEERPKVECVCALSGHSEAVGAVVFINLPTPRLLTGSQDRTIKCWDLDPLIKKKLSHEPYATYSFKAHDKDINAISVSPHGQWFASASQDKTVKIWSVANGELIGVCQGHKRGVWKCDFAPLEQILATCSGDKTIKLWNLKDFSCIRTFEGHSSSIVSVRFISYGSQLLSTDADGLLKLWTIKANQCTLTLDAHEDRIWALLVSADESTMVTGGADALVQFWKDSTEEDQLALVQKETDALLREQDLSNYLLKKDYKNSIFLALTINHPFKLLGIFKEMLQERSEENSSTEILDKVISVFNAEQLEVLLGYLKTWNAQAKTCIIAHIVFNSILKSHSLDFLIQLPSIHSVCEAFCAYTEQHINRLDDLLTQTYLLDYTLHSIDKVYMVPLGRQDEGIEGLGKRKPLL